MEAQADTLDNLSALMGPTAGGIGNGVAQQPPADHTMKWPVQHEQLLQIHHVPKHKTQTFLKRMGTPIHLVTVLGGSNRHGNIHGGLGRGLENNKSQWGCK